MKKIKFYLKDTAREKNSLSVIIAMAFACIISITLFSISYFFQENAAERLYQLYGYFDNILYANETTFNGSQFGQEVNNQVEEVGTLCVLEAANEKVLGYADEKARELGNISILEGKYPESSGEIAVCNSVLYQEKLNSEIGSTFTYNGKNYTLVGIVNEYASMWNYPTNKESILMPKLFLSEAEKEAYSGALQYHFLLKNNETFSQSLYNQYPNLVRNVVRDDTDSVNRYELPSLIVLFIILCSFFLNLYVLIYYFDSIQKKIAILRCLCLTKKQSVLYVLWKLTFLLIGALILGELGGYGISRLSILLFSSIFHVAAITIPAKYFVWSVLVTLLVVGIALLFSVRKIIGLSPMSLFVLDGEKERIFKNGKTKKEKRLHFISLIWIHIKRHWNQSIIVILLMATSFLLFHSLATYIKLVENWQSTGQGQIASDFDYEFLTDFEMTALSDTNGTEKKIRTIPDMDSVFFSPDYEAIISDEIVNDWKKNSSIRSVDEYLEVNNLYLYHTPDIEENDYLKGYLGNKRISGEVAQIFGLEDDMLNIQFLGYSKNELLELIPYVDEGEIDIDAVLSGEEMILLAPSYEMREQRDGSTLQIFVYSDSNSESENIYHDSYYSVGDEIQFCQIIPKNLDTKGYLNQQEVENGMECKNYSTKVGAIIRKRVKWFDNATQLPTAYYLVGLNETIDEMGMSPTSSRIRIFLQPDVSYEQFDAEMWYYYQEELSQFLFRNRASEMQELKNFQIFIRALSYVVMAVAVMTTITILLIEERIRLRKDLHYYTTLHLLGLSRRKIGVFLLLQAFFLGIITLLVTFPSLLVVLKYLYGDWYTISLYFDVKLWGVSLVVTVGLFVVSSFFSKFERTIRRKVET